MRPETAMLCQPALEVCIADSLQIILGYLDYEDQQKLINQDSAIKAKAKTIPGAVFFEIKNALEQPVRKLVNLSPEVKLEEAHITQALLASQTELVNEEKVNRRINRWKCCILGSSLIGVGCIVAAGIVGGPWIVLVAPGIVFEAPLLLAVTEHTKTKLCRKRDEASNNVRAVDQLTSFTQFFKRSVAVSVQPEEADEAANNIDGSYKALDKV